MKKYGFLVLVVLSLWTRPVTADTVIDGQIRRYGCIRVIDSTGLLLDIGCDQSAQIRVQLANLRYLEFNEQVEGFAAVGAIRSSCSQCSCPHPSEYFIVEFTKGAGSIFATDIALQNGRFHLKSATDGKWYVGPSEKISSATRFSQCLADIPIHEVPSSFGPEN
jgi:hypothetical protein